MVQIITNHSTAEDSCCATTVSAQSHGSDWGSDNMEEITGVATAHQEILAVHIKAEMVKLQTCIQKATVAARAAAMNIDTHRKGPNASDRAKCTELTKKFLKADAKVNLTTKQFEDLDELLVRLERDDDAFPEDYRVWLKEIMNRSYTV